MPNAQSVGDAVPPTSGSDLTSYVPNMGLAANAPLATATPHPVYGELMDVFEQRPDGQNQVHKDISNQGDIKGVMSTFGGNTDFKASMTYDPTGFMLTQTDAQQNLHTLFHRR